MSKLIIEISHEDYQRLNEALKITKDKYGFHGIDVSPEVKSIIAARQFLGMSTQPQFLLSDYVPEESFAPMNFPAIPK